MTDHTGITIFSYDELDRLISSTDSFDKTVQYGFDIKGNRTSLTYPADSTNPIRTVAYTYDIANRLNTITDWNLRVWDYNTDGAGRITELIYPNGAKKILNYDDAARLSSLVYEESDTSASLSYNYTRDPQGIPINIDEAGTLAPDISILMGKTSYSHDNDNRLVSTTVPATYGYDGNGNLTSHVTGGVTTTYTHDFDNRLTSYSKDGSIILHTYDGMGNRIARDDNGTQTCYTLDYGRDMSHVLCETDSSGDIIAYYIHGPEIVGRIGTDGSERYYHTNAIGSVVALSDETETITDQYVYTPFGTPVGKIGSTNNPFTYIGGLGVMADADGLYFMRARFYDPASGRFIGKDPVEGILTEPISVHKYNYALNNPISITDPKGEIPHVLALIVVLDRVGHAYTVADLAYKHFNPNESVTEENLYSAAISVLPGFGALTWVEAAEYRFSNRGLAGATKRKISNQINDFKQMSTNLREIINDYSELKKKIRNRSSIDWAQRHYSGEYKNSPYLIEADPGTVNKAARPCN